MHGATIVDRMLKKKTTNIDNSTSDEPVGIVLPSVVLGLEPASVEKQVTGKV